MVLPYTEIRGYLPLGADLLNGTMTLDAAKILCNSLSSCMGFTLSAAAAKHPHMKHVVWLKAADEWVGHNEHLSFIKNAPACTFEVKRYKKAAHGPYCCEGASCPDEDKYAQAEMTCALPSATPNGMPRCSALRGTPLVNVAHLHGLARMSSEYPYSENSGPKAGNDGIIDKRSLVHTQCEGGPQWWRLSFSSPMHLVQLTLHNRADFRFRMVGATVTLRHKNTSALAAFRMGSGRSLYVLSLSPPLDAVSEIEIRSPSASSCLHFSELEAFGAKQAEVDAGQLSFSQHRPAVRPAVPAAEPPGPQQPTVHTLGDRPVTAPPLAAEAAEARVPLETDGRHAPPLPRARAESRHSARAAAAEAGAGVGAGAGASRPGGQPRALEPDDLLWVVGAGSLYTLLLVAFQSLWIKVHWLSMWN